MRDYVLNVRGVFVMRASVAVKDEKLIPTKFLFAIEFVLYFDELSHRLMINLVVWRIIR